MPADSRIRTALYKYKGKRFKGLYKILIEDKDNLSYRKIKIIEVMMDFHPSQELLDESIERIVDCHSKDDIDPIRRSCIERILS